MGMYGWPIASAYNARVIGRWDRIDTMAYAESADTVDDFWESALCKEALYDVLLAR